MSHIEWVRFSRGSRVPSSRSQTSLDWGYCKLGNQKDIFGKSFPGLRSLQVKGLAQFPETQREGEGKKKKFFLVKQNSWSAASSGTNSAIYVTFPNIDQVIAPYQDWPPWYLVSTPQPQLHLDLVPALWCWSLPSAWEQHVGLAALHSCPVQPAGAWWDCLSRAARSVSIWRSPTRTRRATGKGWLSSSQCSAAGRQDHSGRQAGLIQLFIQLMRGWTVFLQVNFPDIISVLNKLHCQIGQWWDRLFSQNHPVASEEQDKIYLQHLFFFFFFTSEVPNDLPRWALAEEASDGQRHTRFEQCTQMPWEELHQIWYRDSLQ